MIVDEVSDYKTKEKVTSSTSISKAFNVHNLSFVSYHQCNVKSAHIHKNAASLYNVAAMM
jgi:hypothetical protein